MIESTPTALVVLDRAMLFLVAADAGKPGQPRTHAVPDFGRVTRHYGISLCGIPVENLAVIAEVLWPDVPEAARCTHCHTDWIRQTGDEAAS